MANALVNVPARAKRGDVVEIKAPGSIYLSAAVMKAGKLFGIRDLIAVRVLHVLLLGIFSAVLFLVANAYLKSRIAAILSFLIPLAVSYFPIMMNGGTQPKLPLMIFGLLSLFFVARQKPFWAGVCSMLACLCWQPGLMFSDRTSVV